MEDIKESYRYSPFLEYGDELEKIISEKAYGKDIADMLRISFPVMIEYYGHEYKDLLFNLLREIDIEIPEDSQTMYDIARKYTPENIKRRSKINNLNSGDLKRADGVHHISPVFKIADRQIALAGKLEVVSVRKCENPLEKLATFVHELSHALKSSKNGMTLLKDKDGNQILQSRSGISVTYSKLYIEDEKIVIEDIEERNTGLDEGINTYDENHIINRILSFPISEIPETCRGLRDSLRLPASESCYTSKGYVQETLCADKLINRCKLGRTIKKDLLLGTNNCEAEYNLLTDDPQNTWQNLNSKIDISVRHTYDRYKNAFNKEWIEEHRSEIFGNLQDIHLMLDKCAQSEAVLQKED